MIGFISGISRSADLQLGAGKNTKLATYISVMGRILSS